jgi:hypothetical protein
LLEISIAYDKGDSIYDIWNNVLFVNGIHVLC